MLHTFDTLIIGGRLGSETLEFGENTGLAILTEGQTATVTGTSPLAATAAGVFLPGSRTLSVYALSTFRGG